MQDITDFLNERKEQYIEMAQKLQRYENAIRKFSSNVSRDGKIPDYLKEVILEVNGGEQLQSAISEKNELLAKVELIEELQEKYF